MSDAGETTSAQVDLPVDLQLDLDAQQSEQRPKLAFPVVGIGASAGGLEAFSEFLSTVTADSGMAFVLVQHLPPQSDSMLVDILAKRSVLPVIQVVDGTKVAPNHVYVIKPGYVLTIRDGTLRLGSALDDRSKKRPVDDFFKSLAEDQRERAICVVMSGMGSNGTAGAQTVKAIGGLCIAQEPQSAAYPSMPRSLIESGNADYSLRPKDMFEVLVAYAAQPYLVTTPVQTPTDDMHLRELLGILLTRAGRDFAGYKKPTLWRRVQRRMSLNRMDDLASYTRLLRQAANEVTALADDLLIHVTGFFRDGEAWESLRQRVIVPLVHERDQDSSIRCWVAACASGEEAYTLAMLLVEASEAANKRFDIKVFATDSSHSTLGKARNGVYAGGIESEITPERLERFFVREEAVYRVRPELRERVVFAPQDLLRDPPFSQLDIVSCRNLLIYLEAEAQKRVLAMLHFGLREGGALFLGTSETVPSSDELFEPIDKKARIFRRIGPTRHGHVDFPKISSMQSVIDAGSPTTRFTPRLSIAQLTTKTLLESHTPAAVTIDRQYRVVFYHGDTNPFFNQPRGEPTRELFSVVRDSVRGAVRTALHRASRSAKRATSLDGWIIAENGERTRVAVTASPLDTKHAPDHYVVSFEEVGSMPAVLPLLANAGDGLLAQELVRARDELHSTIEELQNNNEEMKASHEEVVSINEELQSSNEELETNREELQSLNEELTTVNAQLHSKMDELQAANNDMASLLASTDIAVLFLDSRFRIRRFTAAMKSLLDAISTDLGRPLADLAKKFVDPNLIGDAEAVLASLVPIEREIAGTDERWYLRRILPYRTADDRIDGVVVTFIDVTARRRISEALQDSERRYRAVAELVPDQLWRADAEGSTDWHNHRWYEYTGQTRDAALGWGWLAAVHSDDREAFKAHFIAARASGEPLRRELRLRSTKGEHRWFLLQAAPVRDDGGQIVQWFGAATDVHEQRVASELSEQREEQLRLVIESQPDFAMFMVAASGQITAWNRAAEQLLGWTVDEAMGREVGMIFTPEDRLARVDAAERELAERRGKAAAERWYVGKTGKRFWGSGVLSAVRGNEGVTRGYVMILRDETERKDAQDAVHVAKDVAERANLTKDQFLATLSHELRTPLSVITLYAKMLDEDVQLEPEQIKAAIAAIGRGAEAQRALIDDLLDVSRITSGKLQLQPRTVRMTQLVREAVDAVTPTAALKRLELTTDLDDAGIAWCDPERIRQVLWNLLTNAIKFTPSGGNIHIELRCSERDLEVIIRDSGRGIEAGFLPHVFERYRQADLVSTRSHGGLGLGLAIVKSLVELHGGTVTLDSAGLGCGTTATVRLPRLSGQETLADDENARDEAAIGKTLSGRNVLLIEDESDTRRALVALLRHADMRVVFAPTVRAAWKALASGRPDIIVSDIGLPDEDGFSFMRELRQREQAGHLTKIPAIALTAFVRADDRQRAFKAGFQAHVGKPFEPHRLLATMSQLLEAAVAPEANPEGTSAHEG